MSLPLIECSNCESAQFLQITKSHIRFDDGDDPESMSQLTERYECTLCGATGGLKDDGEVHITGDVQVTDSEVPA